MAEDPNPPQGTATQTDPLPEAMEDDSESKKDVMIEEERIITEGGGITPITLADDDSWIRMTKRIKLEPKPPLEQ